MIAWSRGLVDPVIIIVVLRPVIVHLLSHLCGISQHVSEQGGIPKVCISSIIDISIPTSIILTIIIIIIAITIIIITMIVLYHQHHYAIMIIM